jgi:hypothetical protein
MLHEAVKRSAHAILLHVKALTRSELSGIYVLIIPRVVPVVPRPSGKSASQQLSRFLYSRLMKRDALQQFVALRRSLESEKAQLETRLAAVNQALGTESHFAPEAPVVFEGRGRPRLTGGGLGKKHAKHRAGPGSAVKRRGNLGGNAMSLREAVVQVTTPKALTKKEILAGVDKLGYKFTTKDPTNSLNQILYKSTNPKFRNADGKFSPA